MLGMAGVLMGEQGFKKGEKFPFFSDRLCRTIRQLGAMTQQFLSEGNC